MQKISLSGDGWQLQQRGKETRYPAHVPGGVHTDLMASGVIPDPFVGDTELAVQWVAEADWSYSRTFTVPEGLLKEEHVYLVCDGLDTLGRVSLNGKPVGSYKDMFIPYCWEVKGLLKPGQNEIVFDFDSPVKYAREHEEKFPLSGVQPWTLPGGPYVRKAPCQFGWDWGPMLPPIGIWKDLRLEGYSTARIKDAHLRQHLENGKGRLEVTVTVEAWQTAPLTAVMKVTAPDGKVVEQQAEVVGSQAQVEATIEAPELWWPNDLGGQPLYRVEVSLRGARGTLDGRDYQIGFRTIELNQEPDEWGEAFRFMVNGVPVFAKGADWIPADSFPTRISDAFLEGLIRSAADAHMNMLRVWGGGFYEEERFYDLCDRYGILVWQDFIFACNKYPTDEDFVATVREEAIANVRRLRHRPSLALWCGNNEMEQGWVEWGWNKPEDPVNQRLKMGYDRMYHHLLPDIVAAEDPDRRYWPSSASSGLPFSDPNGQQRGDCHYWEVWHGRKPFTAYRTQFPRFMSEFGFQSLPPLKTIKAYAEEKDWNMTSYIMEHHQRSYKGNGLIMSQMTDTFRMPKDFPSLVYLSMVLQAEGIRYGVEHWRRHKERVGGILYWQLNDCWPVASWASLDSFGRWKALHYKARHFYAPLLLSIEDVEEKAEMNVWLTSDLTEATAGVMDWQLATLDGKVLESGSVQASLKPYESRLLLSKAFDLTPEQKRKVYFAATLKQEGKVVSRSIATFIANKHLELVDPQLQVTVHQDGDLAVFDLSSRSLARFVELALEGADVVFSDNYFDVPAGVSVTVTCPIPAGWTLEQVKQALRVSDLYQSF